MAKNKEVMEELKSDLEKVLDDEKLFEKEWEEFYREMSIELADQYIAICDKYRK